jgi:hypothetical protein
MQLTNAQRIRACLGRLPSKLAGVSMHLAMAASAQRNQILTNVVTQ